MNTKLNENFGVNTKALPLKNITQIVCGNACRLDWNEVCPHTPEEEVFIFGNPPYLGSRRQDESQKNDMKIVFKKDFGELDYIACWFMIGAKYIKDTKAKYAFVSTNSICQGLQVALLWKRVLKDNLVINFAYKSFKWQNNAKYNAAVICVIVGVSSEENAKYRLLYDDKQCKEVKNISPLLMDGPTIFVKAETTPICKGLPQMNFGNMPADGGKLILSDEERRELITKDPDADKFIHPLIGAEEFINGKRRWCIWLYGEDEKEYQAIPEFTKRIEEIKAIRKKSSRPQLADIPHLFAQITQPIGIPFIIIPRVS
jgi:type II restriction/modification system DNA methylase subunit YeeA